MAQITQYYNYLTTQGVMVPDTSEVLAEIESEMKALFGENLDTAPETPQGRLIEMFQRSRTFTIQAMAAISNMFNLNKANGFVLDDLGALFLISRQPATQTEVAVSLGGTPGTLIPKGTRLQSEEGDIFVLSANYTLGTGEPAIFLSEDTGPIPCPPNTLTIILDQITGLETATNPAAPTLGQNLESDSAFRERIQKSLNINSIAIISAIKANLEAIEGVVDTYCYDNYTDESFEIDEVTIPPHSILAAVDGGNAQTIAKVLYSKKSLGAGYVGDTSNPNIVIEEETVIDEAYGSPYKVRFVRPDIAALAVEITVNPTGYTGTNLTLDIQNAIIAWVAGQNPNFSAPGIGSSVSPYIIAQVINSVIPEVFVSKIELGKVGDTLGPDTITMDKIQKATIAIENISVIEQTPGLA